MPKANTIQIRLSDEELRVLNEGWFEAVKNAGCRMNRSEYIRFCFKFAYDNLRRLDDGE